MKYIVLNDKVKLSARDLVASGIRIAITTYGFVLAQAKKTQSFCDFAKIVTGHGYQNAMNLLPDRAFPDAFKKGRPCDLLASPWYSHQGMEHASVILDEGHMAKSQTGKIHEAIRRIPKKSLFILTGSIVPNNVWDLFGIMHLFPGEHPFSTQERFRKTFAKKINNVYTEPSPSKLNRLVKYMMGFTVARPSSVLNLPGLVVQYHDITIDSRDAELSAVWAFKFVQAVRWGKGNGDPLKARREDQKAMFYAARARQYIANRLLITNRSIEVEENILSQWRVLMKTFTPTCKEKDIKAMDDEDFPGPRTIVTDDAESQVKDFMDKASRNLAATSQVPPPESLVDDGDLLQQESGANMDTNAEEIVPVAAEEPENENYDDGEGDDEKADPSGQTSCLWLNQVKQATTEQLMSSKVKEILQLVVWIRKTYPSEKIIIFSYFLKFQDIIAEAIHRKTTNSFETIRIIRIDGTMSSTVAAERQNEFESSGCDTLLLLTTAGAHGVNLQCASQIIQAEPWWNSNEEKQAYCCFHRQN